MEKETRSIADLPSELFFNEILLQNDLSDALRFCSVNRNLRKLCSDQNVWLSLFRRYNLVQKQDALKEWAYSGLMVDTLVNLLSVLPEVETPTLEIVYLYLLEQDPLVRTRYPIFSSFKSDSDYFGPIREFITAFRSSSDLDAQLMTTEAFQRLLESPIADLPEYYSDLLVNALTLPEIELLLSKQYYERVLSHIASWSTRRSVTTIPLSYTTYCINLCQALTRSKRVDVLHPIFGSLLSDETLWRNSGVNPYAIYSYIDAEEEMRIIDSIDRLSERILFLRRVRGNRDTLMHYLIDRGRVVQLLPMINLSYRLLSPEELYDVIKKRKGLKDSIDQLIAIARLASYNYWANRMQELMIDYDNGPIAPREAINTIYARDTAPSRTGRGEPPI